jgi:hypothetical protein
VRWSTARFGSTLLDRSLEIVTWSCTSWNGGTKEAVWMPEHLLFVKLLSSPETPTVIFCGSDLIALGAITALEEAGGRIPEDVSIRYLLCLPRPTHSQQSSGRDADRASVTGWGPPILWPATILPRAGSRTGGWRLWSLAKPSGPRAGFLARREKSLHFNRRSARRTSAPCTTSPRDSNGAAPHAIDYTLRSQPINLGCCQSVGC